MPRKMRRERSTMIGDRVRTTRKPYRRGTIVGWDLRNPHKPVYYILERKKKR